MLNCLCFITSFNKFVSYWYKFVLYLYSMYIVYIEYRIYNYNKIEHMLPALVQSVIRRFQFLCSKWKNPSRAHRWDRIALLKEGESPVLPGEERKAEEGGMVVQVESASWERALFFFQVPLKPILSHGRAGPAGSHPIKNKWGGAWAVTCQVRVGWPSPGRLHEPPTFPTSILPHYHS
jgi:hypothetical protein